EDAQIVAPHLIGPDAFDATATGVEWSPLQEDRSKVRVGIVREHFGEGLHAGARERVEEVIAAYKEMGVSVQEVELPHAPYALAAYYILMPSEVSSNMARFD